MEKLHAIGGKVAGMQLCKKKYLWVLVENKLDMNQQCALTRKKVKHILGGTDESGIRSREGILPLYCSNHYHNNFVS